MAQEGTAQKVQPAVLIAQMDFTTVSMLLKLAPNAQQVKTAQILRVSQLSAQLECLAHWGWPGALHVAQVSTVGMSQLHVPFAHLEVIVSIQPLNQSLWIVQPELSVKKEIMVAQIAQRER